MSWPFLLRTRHVLVVMVLVLAGAGLTSSTAWGLGPEDPQVMAVIEKGLGFLATNQDMRLGGQCLTALCHIKYLKFKGRHKEIKSHPAVQKAIASCQNAKLAHSRLEDSGTTNYSLGIAIMFLCEADPVGNKPLTEKLVAELLRRQQSWGAWGYPDSATGDTSQTQYAVLGMWMAQNEGKIAIPLEAQEAVAGWLVRTQAPDGGWGYQGTDPGGYQRVPQTPVSHSLTAAGLGSLYMVADMLQVTQPASNEKKKKPDEAMVKVEEKPKEDEKAPKPRGGPLTKKIDPDLIRGALALGDGWFRKNYKIETGNWQHYYMYALERYQSFRELVEGEDENPRWYSDGFALLKRTQVQAGGWLGEDSSAVATTFALLFLLRSTKQAIGIESAPKTGIAKGGMGLPPDISDLTETEGKINQASLEGSTAALVELLKDLDSPEWKKLAENAESLKLSENVTEREGQIEQLRKLVSGPNREARKAAVVKLGKERRLEYVPTLLYALTDPDLDVVIAADQALRFVSRKFDGVGMPEEKPTRDQVKAAQEAWRAWYLSIRPNAELLD